VGLGGCEKSSKQLPEEQIHRITRDFVAAGNAVLPRDAEVKGEVGAFDKVVNSSDRIEIHVAAQRKAGQYPADITQLIQRLNAIAIARGLTPDPVSDNGDVIILIYRHKGLVTHTIHVHFSGEQAQAPQHAPTTEGPERGELAIILDDLGNDRAAAETVFALPYHLTVSILPNQTHSAEIAEQAHQRGFEVMLHLPMQSLGREHAEARELHSGMSRAEVAGLVKQFLSEVPDVSGVNNHQGSQSTADARLMAELMPILQARKLFYIDSRTCAATVAYETAQRFQVRTAFRNVPFLDDVEQVAAVRKQIELAIVGAQKKKEAIAIGHAHPATLEALKESLPEARTHGVKLVFASELVR
jgi:polysaccharide deacetylase 2 family uncharacterized protein YibQ